MPEAIVVGTVYPRQVYVSINRYRIRTIRPDNINSDLSIEIEANHVTVGVVSNREWPHPEELLIHCEDYVQGMLNALALSIGMAAEVYMSTPIEF